jgi:hypothetical protein
MNNYEFLISEREHGKFNEHMRRGLLSTKISRWLEVYQYHIEHPNASTWFIANYFGISQTHIREIYQFMETS